MPVTPQAVPHLEGKGHEAVHAANIGLATEPDSALLEHARLHAQVVITADLDSHASWRPTRQRLQA
jgi:predicted nuclease of predicted toxin-antitoxin system